MGGTPIVNDDGTEVTLDTDKAVKAAEFVKSLDDDGYVATGIDDHQKLFQSGKQASCSANLGSRRYGVHRWTEL